MLEEIGGFSMYTSSVVELTTVTDSFATSLPSRKNTKSLEFLPAAAEWLMFNMHKMLKGLPYSSTMSPLGTVTRK